MIETNFNNENQKIKEIEKSLLNTLKIIQNFEKKDENEESLFPVFDSMAFLPIRPKNSGKCTVYLGENYFIQTNKTKAINILKSRLMKLRFSFNIDTANNNNNKNETTDLNSNKNELKNKQNFDELVAPEVKKLSDGTFEIIEEFSEENLNGNDSKIEKMFQNYKKIENKLQSKLEQIKNFKKS